MNFLRLNAFLVLVLFALFFTRFFLITADPAAWISSGNGLFTDEGYKTDYARLMFLGEESQIFAGGDFATSFNNPVINYSYIASFLAFGIGFFSIRLVAIILSIASVALLVLLLKERFGTMPALLSGILLASSFVFFSYSRLAFFENFLLFFITASFFAMHLAFKKSSKMLALLSLLLLALAILCKFTAIIAFPAIALLLLFFIREKVEHEEKTRFAVVSITFFIIANAALNFFNYNISLHGELISGWVPTSIFILARDFLIAPGNEAFISSMLFSLIGFGAALLFALEAMRAKEKEKSPFVLAFALFLFTGFIAFASFTYQPSRYFYLLLPALAIFAGLFFDRIFSRQPFAVGANTALKIFSIIFLSYLISVAATKLLFGSQDFMLALASLAVFFAVSAAGLFFAAKILPGAIEKNANAQKALFFGGILLFALIVISQLWLFAGWASSPAFSLQENSREFGEIAAVAESPLMPPLMPRVGKPVAAGQWCPAFAVETNVVCQRGPLEGPIAEAQFSSLGIEFLFADASEWQQLKGTYESYESVDFVLLRNFSAGNGGRVSLFAVEKK